MSQRNKLKPDEEASGDHTTFLEDVWGRIIRYATYIQSWLNPTGFDEVKRVDLEGKPHINKTTGETISTPHVHEKASTEVRKALENEIPKSLKKNDNDKS